MFSGIGGFELGIGGEHECVGFSEIDKYAIKIYQKHFPTHKNYGDCTTVIPEQLPDFDLLCGGFPCQSFSIAGKRGGFEDTRGTLFFEIARIARVKRPSYLLLENVKGLLSHDEGNTFATIIAAIDELGYDCQWQVLNSKNFGVPQNRERVFIVGHLRGTGRPKVFPFRENDKVDSGEVNGLHDSRTIAGALRATDYKGTHNVIKESKFIDLQLEGSQTTKISRTLQARYYKGYSTRYGENSGVLQDMKIRRLTPTECERLQGFPDGWTEGISDTQRYKCLGNAVTVNVIRELVKAVSAQQKKVKEFFNL